MKFLILCLVSISAHAESVNDKIQRLDRELEACTVDVYSNRNYGRNAECLERVKALNALEDTREAERLLSMELQPDALALPIYQGIGAIPPAFAAINQDFGCGYRDNPGVDAEDIANWTNCAVAGMWLDSAESPVRE